MLSNQKLQNSLNEIKEISHMDTALFTAKGKLVAHTEEMPLPEALEQQVVVDFAESLAEKQTYQDYHLYKVMVEGETEYILVCLVKEESFLVCAQMAVCQIRNLVMSFAEQFDRNNFMQNIILGNMLIVDIYGKAKKHHIQEVPRVVFVIDTGSKNNDMAMELVKNLADIRSKDFVTCVDQHSIVLIKDVSHIKEEEMEEHLSKIAGSLADNLHMEAMIRVRVGYGNVVTQLPEIAESYQEAMATINKFFENNLNISETARQLYVHRNTLVYRLERIEKAIGLDIRTFDDAMTFRIAVMVIAHMKDQM